MKIEQAGDGENALAAIEAWDAVAQERRFAKPGYHVSGLLRNIQTRAGGRQYGEVDSTTLLRFQVGFFWEELFERAAAARAETFRKSDIVRPDPIEVLVAGVPYPVIASPDAVDSLNWVLHELKATWRKSPSLEGGDRWVSEQRQWLRQMETYCLVPEARVLTADFEYRALGDVVEGNDLLAFDEFPVGRGPGSRRHIRASKVLATRGRSAEVYRIYIEDRVVSATGDHMWLTGGNKDGSRPAKWTRTDQLAPGTLIHYVQVNEFVSAYGPDYDLGYIQGLTTGDEHYHRYGEAPNGRGVYSVSMKDLEAVARLIEYFGRLGVTLHLSHRRNGLHTAQVFSREALSRVDDILSQDPRTPSYEAGWLAGFFDAEGTCISSSRGFKVTLTQRKGPVLGEAAIYSSFMGVPMTITPLPQPPFFKHQPIDVANTYGFTHVMRFLTGTRPAIKRKTSLAGKSMRADRAAVVATERLGQRADVVSLRTSTGTFLADGLLAHNCHALDTREAQLDVLFVNGDYGPPVPEIRSWRLSFSDEEVEKAWQMVSGHAKRLWAEGVDRI